MQCVAMYRHVYRTKGISLSVFVVSEQRLENLRNRFGRAVHGMGTGLGSGEGVHGPPPAPGAEGGAARRASRAAVTTQVE